MTVEVVSHILGWVVALWGMGLLTVVIRNLIKRNKL